MGNNSIIRKYSEKLILFLIYLSAVSTVLVLFSIVGYIVYKGSYQKTSSLQNIISTDREYFNYGDDKLLIITNSSIKKKSISIIELENILSGSIKDWSSISEQRNKINLFLYDNIIDRNNYVSVKIIRFHDIDSLLSKISAVEGSVGIIPFSMKKEIRNKKIKILKIDTDCIVAGHDVVKFENNKKLNYINEGDLEKIINGEIKNWSVIGGPDIPIQVFKKDNIEKVQESRGGIAVADYRDALRLNADIIPVKTVKKGINLSLSFLIQKPAKAGRVGGISTIILNTFFMIILTLLFAVPVGLGGAIYLTEYSADSRYMRIIRLGIETLAGIPSIIFGLFGFIFFVDILKMGIGLISGSLTVTLMIIPVIIRTSEEALRSVPDSYREGSLALGAGQWYTIKKVIIPAARPGIISGIILSSGRALGETAALVFTMGFDYRLAKGLKSSARVLSVHLYQLVREGISFERAFATALVLLVFIFIINITTVALTSGYRKNGE